MIEKQGMDEFKRDKGESFNWQKDDTKSESKYSIVHLALVFVLCLLLGIYLAGEAHANAVESATEQAAHNS